MQDTICSGCERCIMPLETYICVGARNFCDACYMNMSTKQFIESIGGRLIVKE